MTALSDRHAELAARFGDVIAATTDWDAPTPVTAWVARDIPEHLLTWCPGLLASLGGPQLPDDPKATIAERWASRTADIQTLLEDPTIADLAVAEGPFAGSTVAGVLAQIYLPDIFMHTWDLAEAAGVEASFDQGFAAELLEGMKQVPHLREGGQFGPEETTTSEVPMDQLMAFVGRKQHWRA